MIQESNKINMQMENPSISKKRRAWGNTLINFCVVGLIFSSLFKFSRLPGPTAYMASLGYEGAVYFLIAGLELITAIIFWNRSTRPFGLLLVSSYFGGAISAHLASGNPSLARGPYMAYMLSHPAAGVIPAILLLASAWIGTWLLYPKMLSSLRERAGVAETGRQGHQKATMVS